MEAKKIIDYKVISYNNLHLNDLEKKVLEHLEKGYVLVGGASNGGDYGGFTQTMIKYEE